MTRLVITGLLFLLMQITAFAQSTQTIKRNQIASFMSEGASGSEHHYIVEPDGTLSFFKPGEKSQPFAGIDNVKEICSGQWHILALKNDGTVWAWGNNERFQLGSESLIDDKGKGIASMKPVQVEGISNAIGIAVYDQTSYALLKDGTLLAWGKGSQGLTGNGEKLIPNGTAARLSAVKKPAKIVGLQNVVTISGAMALLKDGTVWTWGAGTMGRLGNGDIKNTSTPIKVPGIENAVAISSYEQTCLALLKGGTVKAWGTNYKGQLGNGSKANGPGTFSAVPVTVSNVKNAVDISAHAVCIALLKDSTIMVWGWNEVGGLGSDRGHDFNVAGKLLLPGKVISIKGGHGTGFALLQNGTWMGWGASVVATGLYRESYKPVTIATLKK